MSGPPLEPLEGGGGQLGQESGANWIPVAHLQHTILSTLVLNWNVYAFFAKKHRVKFVVQGQASLGRVPPFQSAAMAPLAPRCPVRWPVGWGGVLVTHPFSPGVYLWPHKTHSISRFFSCCRFWHRQNSRCGRWGGLHSGIPEACWGRAGDHRHRPGLLHVCHVPPCRPRRLRPGGRPAAVAAAWMWRRGGGRSSSPRTTPHATRHAAHHTAYHTTRHTPHTTITPHATLHGPPPPHATPHATHHASPLATPHTTRHTGAAGWPNPAFVPTYITVATGNYILYWMGSKGLTLPLMTSGWRASHTRGEPWNDWLWLGDTHSHSPFLCCAAASD